MSNASTSFCPGCGQPFDPSRATYDKNGNLQCDACAVKNQIATGDARAATSVVSAAGGILGGGLAALFCFNPFGLTGILTIVSGAGWFAMISGNQSLRAAIGSKYTSSMLMVVIGMALATLSLVAIAMRAMGMVLMG
jgi:hypothetical protein